MPHQFDDGVLAVILSGQQSFHSDIVKICFELIQHFLDLRNQIRIVLFIAHLDHGLHIFHLAHQILICLHVVLQALQFLHFFLRLFRVVPEIRRFHLAL